MNAAQVKKFAVFTGMVAASIVVISIAKMALARANPNLAEKVNRVL